MSIKSVLSGINNINMLITTCRLRKREIIYGAQLKNSPYLNDEWIQRMKVNRKANNCKQYSINFQRGIPTISVISVNDFIFWSSTNTIKIVILFNYFEEMKVYSKKKLSYIVNFKSLGIIGKLVMKWNFQLISNNSD